MEIMPNKVFRAREVAFKEGDAPNGVFYICSGRMQITRNVNGTVTPIRELETGDVFGELAMIDNRPRSATITALEDTWVYHFTPQAFEKKMQEMDKFMYEVFMSLVVTVRNMNILQEELTKK